jgi:DNA polymerase III subunit delta
MPALTREALATQAKAGSLLSLYLIVGDDEQAKDEAIAALIGAIPEDLRGFNVERVSAADSDPVELTSVARTLPLLGDHRLIIVTRAERWFSPRRKGKAADEPDREAEDPEADASTDSAALLEYLESPEPMSSVVFVAADVNRTIRSTKALVKHAAVVECWGLKDAKEVRGGAAVRDALQRAGRYVTTELKKAGLTIDRQALGPLLEHAGLDMATLRNDVERLALYCHGASKVTLDDVREVVSGSALIDAWAIVNAIERGDTREGLRQLGLTLEIGAAPYMVLGQLAWFVRSRLPAIVGPQSQQLAAAVEAVFAADLAMKSSGGEARVLLERLVVQLSERRRQPLPTRDGRLVRRT